MNLNLLKGSAFLKIAALAVAVLAYLYIHSEIESTENEKKAVSDPSYKLIKLTAKSLPVKVRLEAPAPEGYRIVEEQVSTAPSQVIVIGPEALLEEALTAETAIVDVSDNTRNVSKKIPVESVAGVHLSGQPYLVDVTVPIEKLPEEAAPENKK